MERFRHLLNGILLLGFISLLFSSCYYDNSEELYPDAGSNCDTTDVSYAATIAPIMQAQCVSCHSGANPSGGFDISNYTNQSASAQLIYERMIDVNSPMPPAGLLDACSVNKVKSWYENGAKNN